MYTHMAVSEVCSHSGCLRQWCGYHCHYGGMHCASQPRARKTFVHALTPAIVQVQCSSFLPDRNAVPYIPAAWVVCVVVGMMAPYIAVMLALLACWSHWLCLAARYQLHEQQHITTPQKGCLLKQHAVTTMEMMNAAPPWRPM